MKWFAFCALVACLIGVIPSAGAQESVIKGGETIRIRPVGDERFHDGELERLTTDSVILARCQTCSRTLYSRGEVANLDVYRVHDRGNRTLTGIGVGGLIGLGLGLLAATTCKGGDKCDAAIVAIPFGGIAGMLVGGIVGYARGYKWQPVIPSAGR